MSKKFVRNKYNRYFRLLTQTRSVVKAEGTSATIEKIYRYLGMKVFGENFYQKPIIDCIWSYVAKHRTFIDIGAYTGGITTAVAHQFERCLSIEPLPQNVMQLCQVTQSNKFRNIKVIACALGDGVGSTKLYFSRSGLDNSSLIKHDNLGESIEVPITTLDLIVEETGVMAPFFIKIDVEGYELFVFRGARRTLAKE